MAFGKNARVDSRRSSSSYCSTVTLVAFVALCLVGVWMMASSNVVPVQNIDIFSSETNNEVKQVTESSAQFEDSPGDLPEDSVKRDNSANDLQDESKTDGQDNQNPPEQTINIEQKKEEKSEESEDKKIEEDSNTEKEKDEDKKTEEDSKSEKERDEDKKTEEDSKTEKEKDEDKKTEEDSKIEKEKDGDEKADVEESKEENGEPNSGGETKIEGGETNSVEQTESEASSGEKNPELNEGEKRSESEENSGETKQEDEVDGKIEEKVVQDQEKEKDQSSDVNDKDGQVFNEVFPAGSQSEILNETTTQNGAFSTQALESKNEKESQKYTDQKGYGWKLCNVTAGPDYIPCLDNLLAIRKLQSTKHYEHRERHCPEEAPTCLVPLPEGYRSSIKWPKSREKIWYYNVPHTKLAEVKGHQNWVKVSGEYLTFPGGGTQFKFGAPHYIDFIQESVSGIAWGKHTRVVLDVGCGVASFGGYLFDKDVLTMSFAPKDEHEAQVQFALERGIPAISAVMGTKRLPFPSKVFDVVHCARCRVPWHIEGGKLLLELNRVLRPGGYFVWSATPVYQKKEEDVGIWKAMSELTKSMCWDLVTIKKDKLNNVGVAIYRKPSTNTCYETRPQNEPPLCQESDDADAAWNVPLQTCMHRVPVDLLERGSKWPEQWPERLEKPPYWLKSSLTGVYGKPAPEDFKVDYEHWKRVVTKSYLKGTGINWSSVRNVMDMRSIYGGFAAALRDLNVWVMNVVTIDSPDTLPIIYERGLFGMYHDWCESFSTYPRSYDLVHADHLFSKAKKRCTLVAVVAEVDRILRPEGKLIVRDNIETIVELENMARSLQWDIRLKYSQDKEGLLCFQKTLWRPTQQEMITYAIH